MLAHYSAGLLNNRRGVAPGGEHGEGCRDEMRKQEYGNWSLEMGWKHCNCPRGAHRESMQESMDWQPEGFSWRVFNV